MNIPDTQNPVFIDQMPDYRQALAQVVALSKDEDRFRAVAAELGLSDDLNRLAADAGGIKLHAQMLNNAEQQLEERKTGFRQRTLHTAGIAGVIGSGAMLGAGIGSGIVAGKRWGKIRGTLTGVAAMAITGAGVAAGTLAILGHRGPESTALAQDSAALELQKQELVRQQMEIGAQFADKMATRMLEQQKMLVGQGDEMRLVSTAGPQATISLQSMAQKYALAPSANHVEAMIQASACSAPQR